MFPNFNQILVFHLIVELGNFLYPLIVGLENFDQCLTSPLIVNLESNKRSCIATTIVELNLLPYHLAAASLTPPLTPRSTHQENAKLNINTKIVLTSTLEMNRSVLMLFIGGSSSITGSKIISLSFSA